MFSSLLQKAGLRPGLALHSAIPKVLMAAAMVGGAGSLLARGSAQAANLTPCIFGNGTGTEACQKDVWYDSSLTSDKQIMFLTLPDLGKGDIEFLWNPIDPPSGYTGDTWSVDVDFTPDITAPEGSPGLTGLFTYTIKIDDASSWDFRDVELDATGTNPYTVIKEVYGDAGFTNLLTSLNVPPGPDGPSGSVAGLKQLWVKNTYSINALGTLDNFQDTYRQKNEVPGPLPLMGAGMAFGFSRKLRSRIKARAGAKA